MMIEAFDPASSRPARGILPGMDLSDEAMERIDGDANVRANLERLLANELGADALAVIVRSLPVQYLVALGCDCLRQTGPAVALTEADLAGLALAEQCIKHPSEDHWRLCLDFAERSDFNGAGAWIAAAAGWAEGSLTSPGIDAVRAPPAAVADAVLAALRSAARGAAPGAAPLANAWARRALEIFGAR